MAKIKVFTVFDVKSSAYMQPFYMHTVGQAVRAWMDSVNDPKTQFNKHPEDFTLFEVAEYDDETGTHITHVPLIPRGNAIEFHRGYDAMQGQQKS